MNYTHRSLINAVMKGDVLMVNTCIANGVKDKAGKYGNGMTALMYACIGNELEIVKILLEADNSKEYIDFVDRDGWSALMYVSQYGHTDIVSVLINANANVN